MSRMETGFAEHSRCVARRPEWDLRDA